MSWSSKPPSHSVKRLCAETSQDCLSPLKPQGTLLLSSHSLHLFRGRAVPATPAHSCPRLWALPPTSPSPFSCRLGPGSERLCQACEGASADVPSCCCHSGRDVWLGIWRRRTKQVWLPGRPRGQRHPFFTEPGLYASQGPRFLSAQLQAPADPDPVPGRRLHWSSNSLPCGSGPGGTETPRPNGTCFKEFEKLIWRERDIHLLFMYLVG